MSVRAAAAVFLISILTYAVIKRTPALRNIINVP